MDVHYSQPGDGMRTPKYVVLRGDLGTDQGHTLHHRQAEMRYKIVIAILFVSIVHGYLEQFRHACTSSELDSLIDMLKQLTLHNHG